MAFLARCSGKDLPSWAKRIPEAIFAIPFGYALCLSTGIWYLGILGWLWTYFAMELGHGNAYHMGKLETQFPDRHQTLDYLVRPITNRLGFLPRSESYCWVFMGIKGLLIGLPAAPAGILLAFFWPFAYWIAFWLLKRDSAPAEWISGAFAGILVAWSLS